MTVSKSQGRTKASTGLGTRIHSLPHGTGKQCETRIAHLLRAAAEGALSCSRGGRVSWPPACMPCNISLDDHEAWQLLDIVQDAYSFT